MEGIPEEYIDFLINEDLPTMQKVVKDEMNFAFNQFKTNKKFQKRFITKLSNAIKKKILGETLIDAINYFEEQMKDVEIIQYAILSRTENSVVFEIYFDNRFFILTESIAEMGIVKRLFGFMLLTKKKWLKKLEKNIKKYYSPEKYKIEVMEE